MASAGWSRRWRDTTRMIRTSRIGYTAPTIAVSKSTPSALSSGFTRNSQIAIPSVLATIERVEEGRSLERSAMEDRPASRATPTMSAT